MFTWVKPFRKHRTGVTPEEKQSINVSSSSADSVLQRDTSSPVMTSQGPNTDTTDEDDKASDESTSQGWNVFHEVLQPTRLRPIKQKPNYTRKYPDKELEQGDDDNPMSGAEHSAQPSIKGQVSNAQHKGLKKRKRLDQSNSPYRDVRIQMKRAAEQSKAFSHSSIKKSGKGKDTTKVASVGTQQSTPESDDDSDAPLVRKPRLPPPHLPITPSPSVTPAIASSILTSIESSSEFGRFDGDLGDRRSMYSFATPNPGLRSSSATKFEPLSLAMRQRTVLLVSASIEPEKAPVFVTLEDCATFDKLFDILMEERGIASNRVSMVSAKCSWNGKAYGLRKGKPQDWARLQRAIASAWNTEPELFKDECEVEVMIHVDA